MAVDPKLLAAMQRKGIKPPAGTPEPGTNETYQWPVKQPDGGDYNVTGGTNIPAGATPAPAVSTATVASPVQRLQAMTPTGKATAGVDPELLAAMKRRGIQPKPSIWGWEGQTSNAVPGGGGPTDVAGILAKLGGAVKRSADTQAGNMAEKAGYDAAKRGDYPTSRLGQILNVAPAAAVATAGELAPQNRLAVELAALGPVYRGLKAGAGLVSEGASAVPGMLQKFMAKEAPAAAGAVSELAPEASLAPSFTKPAYNNGLLNTGLKEQVARNTAETAGQDLATSQAQGITERADALPNMRSLNQSRSRLDDLIQSKSAEIDEFQKAGGNTNLTPPEQARLKVLNAQLTALKNQSSKTAGQLSSAARAPGIQEMAPAQVPEANQIAVGEAEKATQQAQASRYAQLHPPAAEAPPTPTVPVEAPPSPPPPSNYKTPSAGHRVLADALATQNGANPRHLAAVFANPEIMGEGTETMAAVGKDYQKTFTRLGQAFDGPTYQEITGSRYAPSATQVSKLEGILQGAATKLEQAPETLTAAEAFMARSAGSKLLQGAQGANKALYAADLNAMDNFLENNGVPEIKALSQRYFRAAAKDSLNRILPANKNGTPSVVRALLATHEAGQSLEYLVKGEWTGAAIKAISAASKSPASVGFMARNYAATPKAVATAVKVGGPIIANQTGGPEQSTLPPALSNILKKLRAKNGR